jgi:ABC-type methionine transport system permease subunit
LGNYVLIESVVVAFPVDCLVAVGDVVEAIDVATLFLMGVAASAGFVGWGLLEVALAKGFQE